jgi:8-oxo-dGTP pyrophosphatase MutT (NUDIX family)
MALSVKRISAYALILNEDHVLLSLLNRGPNAGKWNLVGGSIDHGEEPIDALKREIKEEANILIDREPELLNAFSDRYVYQNSEGKAEDLHLIGIIYLVRLSERAECRIGGDGDSSDGCKWFSMKSLPQEIVPFVSRALSQLQ